VHHVGILYDQIMMHGQRNIKLDVTMKFLEVIKSRDSQILSYFDF